MTKTKLLIEFSIIALAIGISVLTINGAAPVAPVTPVGDSVEAVAGDVMRAQTDSTSAACHRAKPPAIFDAQWCAHLFL